MRCRPYETTAAKVADCLISKSGGLFGIPIKMLLTFLKGTKLNLMICELKQNIDLASVVESAGIELKRSGTRHVGLCPFHADKTPSFFVFQDNHYKCFGCGEHGDCIDFIQKLHGLSFKDALKHLGIEQGRITPKVKRDIEKRKRRAKLIKEFRDWEQRYGIYTSNLWYEIKMLMINGIPPEDLDLYASLLHKLPIWEYHRDILINGSDETKFALYKEVVGNET